MRSSVVVISSVNASFNANARNARFETREPEFYFPTKAATRGARHAKRHPKAVIPQGFGDFSQSTRRKAPKRKNLSEPVPSPSLGSSREPSISTGSLRSTASTVSDAAEVVPQGNILDRCFSFLKHVGVNMVAPPYTADEALDNITTGNHGSISLTTSVTKLPLV